MKIKINNTEKNICMLLMAMIFSFFSITICSKSSILYPMNDWVDANCFFTMGKALMNGKILYKEIYEQKGPLLYFMHGIPYWFSKDSFLGVYIIEVFMFGMHLFFAYKCAKLYIEQYNIAILIIPVLAVIIPISEAFAHGDSVEELTICFLMYSLYSVLKAKKENRLLNIQECLLNGVCIAWSLWTKFTILGFYIGLSLYVVLWYFGEKQWKKLGNVIVCVLLGVSITTIPIIVYCYKTNSFMDMIEAYFYNNIFLYPIHLENGIYKGMDFIFNCVRMLKSNISFSIFIVIGIVDMFIRKTKGYIAIILSFFGLLVGTYSGGRSAVYYGLIFSVYTVFGIIVLFRELIFWRNINKIKAVLYFPLSIVIIICSVGTSLLFTGNRYLMRYAKNDLPQYKFAQRINQVENATMLNYGFLDGGFYFAAGCEPINKFFCKLNIPLEEMDEDQNRCIVEGKVDFVVTRDKKLEDYNLDIENYKMVDTASMIFEGEERTYFLYQHY